jgi:hypothetical protein
LIDKGALTALTALTGTIRVRIAAFVNSSVRSYTDTGTLT